MTPGAWYSLPNGTPFLLLRIEYGAFNNAQARGYCIQARDTGPVLTETVRPASWGRRAVVCAPPEVDAKGRPCGDLAREAERLAGERLR